jgi:ABC-type transport system involved in multi-copper enzyme maturation permease subunit
MNALRGPWTIAVYTWREGMRKKTLVGFLILSLLVIFGASFMSSFLDVQTTGEVTTDVNLKLVKDICVTSISIFGMLITIFISASVVPVETENKVVYTVLSKPVRRIQYLLGKFVGVQMIVIMNLVLMGALFFIALYVRQQVLPTLLLWAILLMYFEFLIVSAFTFAVSCTSSSSVLPTIAGLFIYITGNLTEYLQDVARRSKDATEVAEQFLHWLATILYNVLPNLQRFSIKDQIIHSMPNDAPQAELIPQLMANGLVYCVAGFALSYVIFWRKEL